MRISSADRAAFEAIVQEIAPGGRLISVERLRGGISAHMHAIRIEKADGSRTKVTVRRLRGYDAEHEPQGIEYEYGVLGLLRRVGVTAPQPLYLDAAGKHFGAPALVMTYLPGKPNVDPPDTGPWADALAAALVRIHAVTPETADLSLLRPQDHSERIDDIARDTGGDPLADEVVAVLRAHVNRIEPMPPVLNHNDYWSGNTIWNRGRLTGVIDWTHARLGDPRNDVSESRGAMVFDHDEQAADQFLAAYERHAGQKLRDVWFFDLLRASAAYLYYEHWLEGSRDFGLDLDPAATRARLASFLQHGIARSKGAA